MTRPCARCTCGKATASLRARFSSSWATSAPAVAAAVAAAAVAGCGPASRVAPIEGPYGHGRAQFWVVRAHGRPKAVVVLLHGLGRTSNLQFRPWLEHLAHEGDDVIYPRYEQPPPDPKARDGVVVGVRGGLRELGHPHAPLVLVGHSRGGRLAVEAAAYLHPAGVVAIFPGRLNPAFEPPTDLSKIPAGMPVTLLVGDHDTSVGSAGAVELYARLRGAGVPRAQITGAMIRSNAHFDASHLSVYRTDPAARTAIWARVDRLIAQAVGA